MSETSVYTICLKCGRLFDLEDGCCYCETVIRQRRFEINVYCENFFPAFELPQLKFNLGTAALKIAEEIRGERFRKVKTENTILNGKGREICITFTGQTECSSLELPDLKQSLSDLTDSIKERLEEEQKMKVLDTEIIVNPED